jgi:hypothetical protein
MSLRRVGGFAWRAVRRRTTFVGAEGLGNPEVRHDPNSGYHNEGAWLRRVTTMKNTLVAAHVAAAVSLIVSLLTHFRERREPHTEELRHERELKRRLTEKLLDLRLDSYLLSKGVFFYRLPAWRQSAQQGRRAFPRVRG